MQRCSVWDFTSGDGKDRGVDEGEMRHEAGEDCASEVHYG